jgi:hypothetical protein
VDISSPEKRDGLRVKTRNHYTLRAKTTRVNHHEGK